MKKNGSLSYQKMNLERSKRVADTIEALKAQKEKDEYCNRKKSKKSRALLPEK